MNKCNGRYSHHELPKEAKCWINNDSQGSKLHRRILHLASCILHLAYHFVLGFREIKDNIIHSFCCYCYRVTSFVCIKEKFNLWTVWHASSNQEIKVNLLAPMMCMLWLIINKQGQGRDFSSRDYFLKKRVYFCFLLY